jgi:tetratricopeptide (TPR) repeat protein
MARGEEAKAKEWWKSAEEHLRITIQMENREGRWEFAYANLGDLYRLQGRFDEGEREYLTALGPEPRKSSYTNGLNELARLYLDWGRAQGDDEKLTKAQEFHALAMATTKDERVKARLAAQFDPPA